MAGVALSGPDDGGPERAWVLLTALFVVAIFLGAGGNASIGMFVFGIAIEDVLVVVPIAWLATLVAWLWFRAALRHSEAKETPQP